MPFRGRTRHEHARGGRAKPVQCVHGPFVHRDQVSHKKKPAPCRELTTRRFQDASPWSVTRRQRDEAQGSLWGAVIAQGQSERQKPDRRRFTPPSQVAANRCAGVRRRSGLVVTGWLRGAERILRVGGPAWRPPGWSSYARSAKLHQEAETEDRSKKGCLRAEMRAENRIG